MREWPSCVRSHVPACVRGRIACVLACVCGRIACVLSGVRGHLGCVLACVYGRLANVLACVLTCLRASLNVFICVSVRAHVIACVDVSRASIDVFMRTCRPFFTRALSTFGQFRTAILIKYF